jgi:predicted HTH domain antitoxin
MAETVQINLRIDVGLAEELERIAGEESIRRTDIVRKYLIEGVKSWKLERSIRRYQLQQISLERAAIEADLSIYEMMDELRVRGIPLDQTTPAESRKAIQALLENLVTGV